MIPTSQNDHPRPVFDHLCAVIETLRCSPMFLCLYVMEKMLFPTSHHWPTTLFQHFLEVGINCFGIFVPMLCVHKLDVMTNVKLLMRFMTISVSAYLMGENQAHTVLLCHSCISAMFQANEE